MREILVGCRFELVRHLGKLSLSDHVAIRSCLLVE